MNNTISNKTFYLTETFNVKKNEVYDGCKFILINRMDIAIKIEHPSSSYLTNCFIDSKGLLNPLGVSLT